MSQISLSDACDILKKLLDEKIPLVAFLRTSRSSEVKLPGFVDSMTRAEGLAISTSGPPIDAKRGFLRFLAFEEGVVFWYGEKRELPEQYKYLADEHGESVLIIGLGAADNLSLFFTV
jgi:hypothetical protein